MRTWNWNILNALIFNMECKLYWWHLSSWTLVVGQRKDDAAFDMEDEKLSTISIHLIFCCCCACERCWERPCMKLAKLCCIQSNLPSELAYYYCCKKCIPHIHRANFSYINGFFHPPATMGKLVGRHKCAKFISLIKDDKVHHIFFDEYVLLLPE